jgi:hypothetical protein
VGQPHPRPLSGTERGELAGSTAWSHDFPTKSLLDRLFPASVSGSPLRLGEGLGA